MSSSAVLRSVLRAGGLGRSAPSSLLARTCSSSSSSVWPATHPVTLNYQLPPPDGKRTGRYIDQADKGDMVDDYDPREVTMHNGRLLAEAPELETAGFALVPQVSAMVDFKDDEEVVRTYYEEMINVVKSASGADRVFVFDHTIRNSGATSLNALGKGAEAAAVPRVHCDYTADSAPRRLKQLAEEGIYSRLRGRELTVAEVEALAAKRFAFINVWRSISPTDPVYRMPLAVCDTTTVPQSDHFLYELEFPERTGENYSLRFNEGHRWCFFPQQTRDECLVFKVYDQDYDGPRFVFHTAFDDPLTPPDAPPRMSIEVRAIAFFDVDDDLTTPPAAAAKL